MCAKNIKPAELWLQKVLKLEPDFPRVLSWQDNSPHLRLVLEISPEHRCFRGHFPGNPVLPGIVQVHWAIIASRVLFEFDHRPREIKRLKFKSVVIPPKVIDLALFMPAENEVQFNYSSLDQQHSQGRLIFGMHVPC